MTATARAWIAALALIIGAACVIAGAIVENTALVTGGFSAITLVLGYAFGDRNGEKRLAAALTILDAEQRAPGSTTL